MIQLEDVRKAYRTGKINVPVLHGINLTIDDGEMVAISPSWGRPDQARAR